MAAKPLTAKQQRFVEEYLVDLNATQAAIRVGYSARTANEQGARLLANASIRAAVNEAKKAQAARVEVEADTVLRELLRIGTVDVSRAFAADGSLLPIHEMPEDVRRAVSAIEVTSLGATVKVKFWSKVDALDKLGRHLKLFTDKVEHDVSENLAKLLMEPAA